MKRYPKYKDCDVEWIDEIPENWEKYRAKFIFQKLHRPILEKDEVVTAFRDGVVTLRLKRRIEGFTNSLKEIGYQGVRMGDLVIHAMDGFAGAIGVSDSDGKCSPVYSVCVPLKDASTNYYAYLLRNMAQTGYITSLARGIRERSTDFRYREFKDLILPYPDISEQNQISEYLDNKTHQINTLIEKKQKQIELLKEQRTAIINHAVTKGLNPDVKMKDSGIEWFGEMPEHWDVKRLKHCSKFISGYAFSSDVYIDDGIPIIRIGDIKLNIDLNETKKVPVEYLKSCKDFTIKFGDILLALTGATIGKTNVYLLNDIALLNQRVAIIRPEQQISNGFLKYIVDCHFFKKHIDYECIGGAQDNIGKPEVMNYLLFLPPSKEQRFIANYLDHKTLQIDTLIQKQQKQIELLQEFCTTLISEAVTGKIDVRNEVPT